MTQRPVLLCDLNKYPGVKLVRDQMLFAMLAHYLSSVGIAPVKLPLHHLSELGNGECQSSVQF